MKLIPKIPVALLLLGSTLPMCAQNNPPIQCECCTDVCYVVVGPAGSYTYTDVAIAPGTNVCLGTTIGASPSALLTSNIVITLGHWEVHTADCPPDAWFTNWSWTTWTTQWWDMSGPGYSASGRYDGGVISFPATNCGSGTITFHGNWKSIDPCTATLIGGGSTSISTNFTVVNVQLVESCKAVRTNETTAFTLTNTCGDVKWEVSPDEPNGPHPRKSSIVAGSACGTWTVTARSKVNTNCAASATLYVLDPDLRAVTFSSDHGVLTDYNADFTTDGGDVYVPNGWQKSPARNNPVTHTKALNISLSVVINLCACGVPFAGVPFDLTGTGGSGPLNFHSYGNQSVGDFQTVPVTSDAPLAAKIDILDAPISWKITVCSNDFELGASGPHKIYVTWDTPITFDGNTATLKRVDWSCTLVKDYTSIDTIEAKIHDTLTNHFTFTNNCVVDPPRNAWKVLDDLGTKGYDCQSLATCHSLVSLILGIPAYVDYAHASTNLDCSDDETRTCLVHGLEALSILDSQGRPNRYEACCIANGRWYPGGMPGSYDSALAVLRYWLSNGGTQAWVYWDSQGNPHTCTSPGPYPVQGPPEP